MKIIFHLSSTPLGRIIFNMSSMPIAQRALYSACMMHANLFCNFVSTLWELGVCVRVCVYDQSLVNALLLRNAF